jgi:hypothetical protein
MALLLAVLTYQLLGGPAARIFRWWSRRSAPVGLNERSLDHEHASSRASAHSR